MRSRLLGSGGSLGSEADAVIVGAPPGGTPTRRRRPGKVPPSSPVEREYLDWAGDCRGVCAARISIVSIAMFVGAVERLLALRILGCGGWCWHGVGACPMIEVATLQTLGGPDMSNATFSALWMTACGLESWAWWLWGCAARGFALKCVRLIRLFRGFSGARPGYSAGVAYPAPAHGTGASAHDAGGVYWDGTTVVRVLVLV